MSGRLEGLVTDQLRDLCRRVGKKKKIVDKRGGEEEWRRKKKRKNR